MIEPHGNLLINRVLRNEDAQRLQERSGHLRHIRLHEELVKDVKNIARGVYSPLTGFMGKTDFESVVHHLKLANGTVWPIPFVLDVTQTVGDDITIGEQVLLVDEVDQAVAVMMVQDKYSCDAKVVAEQVFGTSDNEHPGVAMVQQWQPVLLGGDIELIDNSKEPFNQYNLDPLETRLLFQEKGWTTVTGFQTRNAPHRAHEYLQRIGLELTDGLFINPVIGKKKTGDFTDQAILAAYDYMAKQVYPRQRVVLSILPLQMRYAGPREAILHAIIRKNFGCSHFIVGRDHAGVGNYYGTYAGQEIFNSLEDIGITILKLENSFHCKRCETIATSKTCGHSEADRTGPSGTVIRKLLQAGEVVPTEIMRPEISELLIQQAQIFVD
ncbi:MAG: sulfate adenylyltransferase [Candidatus Kerfeldbacteria bacterium]|nr:sulfate adenylyltransferase [Candidatus Kerfeldbacteria bacterium]